MPSPSEVRAFIETGTWAEIERRLARDLDLVDIENPDPYRHGIAVGTRRTLKSVLNMPAQLIKEAGTET